MRIFITGGCKNGKSTFAEKIVKNMREENLPLYYIATMEPKDEEDRDRIKRHRKDREGFGFYTVEIPVNIENCLNMCNKRGTFLLDSITALYANEMFCKDGSVNENAYKKVTKDLIYTIKNLEKIVLVSDYIFSDANIYEDLTEKYRMGLGHIHKEVAKSCDVVIEACFSNFMIYKGQEKFRFLYEKII